ncbi:hypothetical protein [Mechercharimyces sp. CAU 1602]|uniref:hypothetical protein n=1 Tax=Mechercharimyces sp. CAU 1602 TaxID=2973933 RepID=UPI00216364B3|nr:hypothetical protein [Mechercharimyces sp. CAU 1602]MCS1350049.1 hypothetical protein [Mechercharimyces sp. CAU 1602]
MSTQLEARFFSPPTLFSGVERDGTVVDINVVGDLFFNSPSALTTGGPLVISFSINGINYSFFSTDGELTGTKTSSDILVLSGSGTLINVDTGEENDAELDFLRAPLLIDSAGNGVMRTIALDEVSVFRFMITVPDTVEDFLVHVRRNAGSTTIGLFRTY